MMNIVARTLFASAALSIGLTLAASAAYADPVAECQKITTSQVETGQCLQDTLTTVDAVLDSALVNAQEAADELDAVTGRTVARPALERSQSAWSGFRTINCQVPAAMAGG